MPFVATQVKAPKSLVSKTMMGQTKLPADYIDLAGRTEVSKNDYISMVRLAFGFSFGFLAHILCPSVSE